VDRSKDLIRSGGEWISSVDLEKALIAHENIIDAAVVACTHPKWGERPIAFIVAKKDSHLDKNLLKNYLMKKFAKWWIPDDFIFIDKIPRNPTGKIIKRTLRESLCNYKFSLIP
jgi:fatty-acyl-CoA synthase